MRLPRFARLLINRLQERSTWMHIVTVVATMSGVSLSETHAEMWMMGGLIVSTVIGVLTKEDDAHKWTKGQMKELADKMLPLAKPAPRKDGT